MNGIRGLLVSLFILSTGCAVNSQINFPETLSDETEASPSEGVVVARIIDAGDKGLPFNFMTVTPKTVNESDAAKSQRLEWLTEQPGGATLFAAQVPEGEYALNNLRAYYTMGEQWYSRWANGSIELGTFNVEAGSITDLGTLVYYPKVEDDKYIDELIRVPNTASLPLLQRFVDTDLLHDKPTLGWNNDQTSVDSSSLYAFAVQNPTAFNGHHVSEDGTVYLFGNLGSILIRRPNGDWSIDAVASDGDLNSMATNGPGDIAIGGNLGKLYFKAQGGDWRDISIDPKYTINQVFFHSENQIDVVAQTYRSAFIQRIDLGGNTPQKEEMARYDSRSGWTIANGTSSRLGANRNDRPPLERIGYIYTNHYEGKRLLFMSTQWGRTDSPFSNHNRMVFEVSPDNWQLTELEKDIGADKVINAGATYLGIKDPGVFSMTGGPAYLRYSQADKEWHEMGTRIDDCPEKSFKGSPCDGDDGQLRRRFHDFKFISVPVFTSELEATAIVKQRDPGDEEPTVLIVDTEDGGERWSSSDKKPPEAYCHTTVPQYTESMLVYCDGASSDVYRSDDWGHTWTKEREHQSF